MINYRSLFNAKFHHGYFLNRGEDLFTTFSMEEQNEILETYNTSEYLRIQPSHTTGMLLKNNRLIFKIDSEGFRVLASCAERTVGSETRYEPVVKLKDGLILNFGLYTTDDYFENYSNLTSWSNNQLYFFTNAPLTASLGSKNILSDATLIDDSYLLNEEGSRKLMLEITKEKAESSNLDNPYDLAAISTADLTLPENVQRLNQRIRREKSQGLIGFMRLYIKGDDAKDLLEFIVAGTEVKQYTLTDTPSATFTIPNRYTFWRFKKHGTPLSITTTSQKPLTKHGFVPITKTDFFPELTDDLKLPNPGVTYLREESATYYSEVYI